MQYYKFRDINQHLIGVFTIGALSDSTACFLLISIYLSFNGVSQYEYLLKQYLLSNQTETRFAELCKFEKVVSRFVIHQIYIRKICRQCPV